MIELTADQIRFAMIALEGQKNSATIVIDTTLDGKLRMVSLREALDETSAIMACFVFFSLIAMLPAYFLPTMGVLLMLLCIILIVYSIIMNAIITHGGSHTCSDVMGFSVFPAIYAGVLAEVVRRLYVPDNYGIIWPTSFVLLFGCFRVVRGLFNFGFPHGLIDRLRPFKTMFTGSYFAGIGLSILLLYGYVDKISAVVIAMCVLPYTITSIVERTIIIASAPIVIEQRPYHACAVRGLFYEDAMLTQKVRLAYDYARLFIVLHTVLLAVNHVFVSYGGDIQALMLY